MICDMLPTIGQKVPPRERPRRPRAVPVLSGPWSDHEIARSIPIPTWMGTWVAIHRAALTTSPVQQAVSSRVLLVEDDGALGELFAQILRERGHQVILASDVLTAITALRAGPIDVVVTDLRLPGASGLELLGWVKREGIKVRVVVASAFATTELALHARRLGARQVLSKPVEPEALVAAVEAA